MQHFSRVVLVSLCLAFGCTLARADVFLVTESGANALTRVNGAGVKTPVADTGLSNPKGVAVDGDGNVFIADAGSGTVIMLPVGGGPAVPVGDVLDGPAGLAFDGEGVLHVSTTGDDTVWKLSGSTFVVLAALPTGASPRAIAFAPSGNLFVADNGDDIVSEITPDGDVSVFSDDVIAPFGLAFDDAGKLHASDTKNGGRIATFNPNGKAHAVATNLGDPRGIAFDRAGDIYFAEGAGELRRVQGNGSVSIATGLDDPNSLVARSAQVSVVAFKGQMLADPADASFAALGSPAIGGAFVAFKGTLASGVGGVSSSNAQGLWRADADGDLALLARRAFPAPGAGGATFSAFGDPVLDAAGNVAFLATLAKGDGVTSANARGVWADVSDTLTLIARQGDAAPGLDAEVVFKSFQQLVLPDDAGPALLALVAGPGITGANNLGLWSADTSGALELVVRKGDSVTVGPGSRTLKLLTLFAPTSLSTGQSRNVAAGRQFTFLAQFTDGTRAILLVEPGQAPVVLAAQGDDVGPALDPGAFAAFGQPCVSDDGAIFGFAAQLASGVGDITPPSSHAVFLQDGTNALEARTTFAAPGTNAAVFATLSDPVVDADAGLALFGKLKSGIGDASKSNLAGLWSDAGAGLQLVARQGDAAPGIQGSAAFSAFKQFVLPGSGGPAFLAKVSGSGLSGANNFGLWADDGAGALELLMRTGDALDVDSAERTVKTLTAFKAATGVKGQSRNFNAAGDVALQVKCTDGTQVVARVSRP